MTDPDSDAISRAVFAATVRFGRPDAFLARELADAARHFLADGDDPAEVVPRVVRELGHPELALALPAAEEPPAELPLAPPSGGTALERMHSAAGEAFRALARRDVYSPDLVAAADAGLLHFFDSETPTELAGGVLAVGDPSAAFDAVLAARERYGQFVAVDGPENALSNGRSAAVWARLLRAGLLATGLRAVVNLNTPQPTGELPLFPSEADDRETRLDDLRQTLVEHLLWEGGGVRVDWHLGERDFAPESRLRLLRLCRRALAGDSVAFAFDRGATVPLAEGLERGRTELLCTVGVDLPRLAAYSGGTTDDVLRRLPTLARLACAAGRARRKYMHRLGRSALTDAFRLERAVVSAVPLGLGSFAGYATDDVALKTALSALRALRTGLDTLTRLDSTSGRGDDPFAGVTSWGTGNARQQVLHSARLQAEVDAGTAVVALPGTPPPADELAHLLWVASRTPGLVRLCVRPAKPVQPSLAADW